ncbi:hypothetical protein WJX84_005160 [Apatococcus fuscideae]|uniref:Uncharacterized protein n=1 Tax=Apatococcus fuscideae TaxID=2026836 RepID=A0AAW1T3V4_9CHLO
MGQRACQDPAEFTAAPACSQSPPLQLFPQDKRPAGLAVLKQRYGRLGLSLSPEVTGSDLGSSLTGDSDSGTPQSWLTAHRLALDDIEPVSAHPAQGVGEHSTTKFCSAISHMPTSLSSPASVQKPYMRTPAGIALQDEPQPSSPAASPSPASWLVPSQSFSRDFPSPIPSTHYEAQSQGIARCAPASWSEQPDQSAAARLSYGSALRQQERHPEQLGHSKRQKEEIIGSGQVGPSGSSATLPAPLGRPQ